MRSSNSPPGWGTAHHLTDQVTRTIERFLHIEAVSGMVLIAAGVLALIWANSPAASAYHALWHAKVSIGLGSWQISQSLHFVVNDMLMTVFFLLAGLEIRREMHEGALSKPQQAILPVATAIGGVIVPALIYLAFNSQSQLLQGWAIPIATDIAFAMGVLALLGKGIPRGVRVLLLALAIIDDVIAVLIIALFYSHELQLEGGLLALAAVVWILVYQHLAIRSAVAYVLPGAVLWLGLLHLGVHPTLAGVILGLLAPVQPLADEGRAASQTRRLFAVLAPQPQAQLNEHELVDSLRQVSSAQLDMVSPVVRLESVLHPWVAYGVMPLFAFANAGVTVQGSDLFAGTGTMSLIWGIALGLLLGKPAGILLAGFICIRMRWSEMTDDVGWRGLLVVAVLGGIGFTMSIFIATLAFPASPYLQTAKLAIVAASVLAGMLAWFLGRVMFERHP